jgi:hypothetical protein
MRLQVKAIPRLLLIFLGEQKEYHMERIQNIYLTNRYISIKLLGGASSAEVPDRSVHTPTKTDYCLDHLDRAVFR